MARGGPLRGVLAAVLLTGSLLAGCHVAPAADGSDAPMVEANLPEAPEPLAPPEPPVPPPPPRPIGAPIAYLCDSGRTFGVTFDEYADQMVVTAGGLTRALPSARSASGARFAKGAMEYWSKGPQAMLTGFPDGPYDNCREG